MSEHSEEIVKSFRHLTTDWEIVRWTYTNGRSPEYVARAGKSDTGTFSTAQQAEDWVREIKA